MPQAPDWLARTLRDLRTQAGLSQAEASTALGLSASAGQARLSRIETGTHPATEDEVRRLCAAYGAPSAVLSVCLLFAARDTTAGGVSARVILNAAGEYQARLGAVEEASTQIRVWQPLLIPGLLQTPAYARKVFSDRLRGKAIDAAVAARQERQRILSTGREFRFVIPEGALRWSAGPEVMREQLDALAAQAHRLGIIPQSRTVTTFPVHGFGLFDDRLAVVGLRHATVLVGDAGSVAEYVAWFAKLADLAVFGDEAREVIRAVAASYAALEDG
jgi:transcriptional regulator with XRE-family HTH domain